MKFSVPWMMGVMLLAGSLLSGCMPRGQGQSDEEKEPNFLAGKSRVNAMDFSGAIECFEKSLNVNPNSAAAHFELGWLHNRQHEDPAAAIYHFQKYLKLRPKADNASIVQQHILACKQELARTVSLGPVTADQQRNLEKLTQENKKLAEANRQLAEEVMKWRAYYAAHGAVTGQSSSGAATRGGSSKPDELSSSSQSVTEPAVGSSQTKTASSPRTHLVRSGETFFSIARKYGVSTQALQRANPGVEPRRLRAGRELIIP